MFFFKIIVLYLIGLALCTYKVKKLKEQGYEEMQYCHCFDPRKWLSFAVGFLLKYLVPNFVLEQYVIRLYDPYCKSNCYESVDGKCVKCGCDAVAKAMSPSETCSAGMWGPIELSRRKYEAHREEYPITIKIERKNE